MDELVLCEKKESRVEPAVLGLSLGIRQTRRNTAILLTLLPKTIHKSKWVTSCVSGLP